MSTVFLFGAGASYGSEDVHPYPPPLGKDLFKALHEFGGIARTVGPDLARLFAENFELGMSEFFRTRNPESTRFLREMAMYFARFTPGPRDLYRRLIEIGRGKEIVLSTTNYDLLIEAAASDAGYLTSHRRPPLPPERLSLLKIHGSIHFLPDLLGSTFIDCRFDTTHAMPGAAAFGASIRLASSNREVWDFCTSQNSISPAIAMYASG